MWKDAALLKFLGRAFIKKGSGALAVRDWLAAKNAICFFYCGLMSCCLRVPDVMLDQLNWPAASPRQ